MLKAYEHIHSARKFTCNRLGQLRQQLTDELQGSPEQDSLNIVVTGSYGRREASGSSDLDWFLIYDGVDDHRYRIPQEWSRMRQILERGVSKKPGDTGTFDAVVRFHELIDPIGGDLEINQMMTRRLLLLLEGTWLFNEDGFRRYRRRLLEKYLPADCARGRIYRFLLNDIIRYYRTITTDFEYKVEGCGKTWGLRNIKLRFSRKMLFFGGILLVAELADIERDDDRAKVLEQAEALLDLPVLDRLIRCSSDDEATKEVLHSYEQFMAVLADPQQRSELEAVQREGRYSSELHTSLREQGDKFSQLLICWLRKRYPSEHMIHQALIF